MFCPKSRVLQKYYGESMWCNNYGQKLVDLRTWVYSRYFVFGFTDLAFYGIVLWGRQFIILPIISRDF